MEVVQSIRSTVGPWVQRVTASGSGEDDESAICEVRTWLREQETSWYKERMHALVSRRRKAVDVDGDYVEKIARVKETSSYTVREFHTFRINSFRENKCGALLPEQPP